MILALPVVVLGAVQRSEPPARVPQPVRGPALIVLLKDGCPCTVECRESLNALAQACRGKLKFVALLDAGAARASALRKEADLEFPIVPDPGRNGISALKGKQALDLRLIGAEGSLLGKWDGFSRTNIKATEETVSQTLGVRVETSLTTFTNLVKYGCEFSI